MMANLLATRKPSIIPPDTSGASSNQYGAGFFKARKIPRGLPDSGVADFFSFHPKCDDAPQWLSY